MNNFQALFLITKRPDLTHEAFRRHQEEVHIPLVRKIPNLRRYTVLFFPPDGETSQVHDLAALLEFDDRASFEAAMASPEAQAAIADQPKINDTTRTVTIFGHGVQF